MLVPTAMCDADGRKLHEDTDRQYVTIPEASVQ